MGLFVYYVIVFVYFYIVLWRHQRRIGFGRFFPLMLPPPRAKVYCSRMLRTWFYCVRCHVPASLLFKNVANMDLLLLFTLLLFFGLTTRCCFMTSSTPYRGSPTKSPPIYCRNVARRAKWQGFPLISPASPFDLPKFDLLFLAVPSKIGIIVPVPNSHNCGPPRTLLFGSCPMHFNTENICDRKILVPHFLF